VVVNQDGTRIVVDSGNAVLTGNTTDDDGFAVDAIRAPDANGCIGGVAYNFKDASDGEANVGAAISSTCPNRGNLICTVGYGGTAVRRDTRSANKASTDDTTIAEIQSALGAAVIGGKGDTSQQTAEELADLVAPVQ
jgi:hypothetical protein